MNELASRFMTEDESREDIMAEAATVAEEHEDSQWVIQCTILYDITSAVYDMWASYYLYKVM